MPDPWRAEPIAAALVEAARPIGCGPHETLSPTGTIFSRSSGIGDFFSSRTVYRVDHPSCRHQRATTHREAPRVIQEPIQPTPTPPHEPGTARAARRSPDLRIVAIIGLVLVAMVAVTLSLAANSGPTSPDAVLGVGATNAPPTTAPATVPQPDARFKGGLDFLKGLVGQGRGGGLQGPGKGPITIKSITGNDLALATPDGWKRTITVTDTTTITKAGQTIKVGDLKVGDEITFRQTKNDDGTYTITAIVVSTPRAGGEVTAVGDTTITVKQRGGTTKVITVNGSTVYKLGSTTGSKSDVTVGGSVDAAGTESGDTFTAITVNVRLAEAGGEVTKVDGNAITVKEHDGTPKVITVNGSTTYKQGSAAATKSDVTVGSNIDASGKTSGDTFTAVTVRIHPAVSGGEVTAKGTNSITIKDKAGKETTIHVDSATKYKVHGVATASIADIAVGDQIIASGARRTDGSLDAIRSVPAHEGEDAPKAP